MKTIGILFSLCILISCQNSPSTPAPLTKGFYGNAMTIDYRVVIGQPLNEAEIATIDKIIKESFEEVNHFYNKYNPTSEISRLNRIPAHQKVPISHEIEELLHLTDKVFKISEGRFDPTIEPIQLLWKKYLYVGQIPPQEEIFSVKQSVGWENIHFEKGLFWKDHDLTSLDFGGIAKGLCVDLIVERLNSKGFSNVFVEWGGEIRASGQHPDERPWQVYITRFGDTSPENAIAKLCLNNQAIATSGDYEQYWKVENQNKDVITYFHVFDPFTCEPLKYCPLRVSSSSVIAPSCALADGLATVALMFDTIQEADAWTKKVEEQIPGTVFLLVSRKDKP